MPDDWMSNYKYEPLPEIDESLSRKYRPGALKRAGAEPPAPTPAQELLAQHITDALDDADETGMPGRPLNGWGELDLDVIKRVVLDAIVREAQTCKPT